MPILQVRKLRLGLETLNQLPRNTKQCGARTWTYLPRQENRATEGPPGQQDHRPPRRRCFRDGHGEARPH